MAVLTKIRSGTTPPVGLAILRRFGAGPGCWGAPQIALSTKRTFTNVAYEGFVFPACRVTHGVSVESERTFARGI